MAVTTRGTRKKQEKKEELLSLNNPKKPTYKPGDAFESTSNASRKAALKDKLEPRKPASKRKPVYRIGDKYSPNAKSKDNEISQAEMDDIDRQIKKIQKDKDKVTEKDIEKVSGKKVVTRNGKKGFLFGKGAKFRPFGGVLARALLGDDEKFGGDKGLIDFIRKKEKPVKKAKGGEMMKKKGYARGGAIGMSKRTAPGVSGGAPARGGKKPPMSRAQSRATLSRAQRQLLDSVQGKEGSKQSTSVIQDLSDKYGFKPGKRAGARGRGRKKATPPGMNTGGMAMRSKMASKGGKMGGKVPPGYKKGGSVGRKKARGVGAAKRGFGRAMR